MSDDANLHIMPDPHSLDRVFSEDPLNLGRSDHSLIIRELRLQRQRFEIAEDKAKRAPRLPGQKAPRVVGTRQKKQKLDPNMTLEDLMKGVQIPDL